MSIQFNRPPTNSGSNMSKNLGYVPKYSPFIENEIKRLRSIAVRDGKNPDEAESNFLKAMAADAESDKAILIQQSLLQRTLAEQELLQKTSVDQGRENNGIGEKTEKQLEDLARKFQSGDTQH